MGKHMKKLRFMNKDTEGDIDLIMHDLKDDSQSGDSVDINKCEIKDLIKNIKHFRGKIHRNR